MASILVVEDDVEIASAVAAHLSLAGHRVRTARNGVDGLRKVTDELPDLILLDVEMPVLDGPGMAEALATQRAGQQPIPIVLVSGAVKLDKIAQWVGTPYYLKKPFSLNRVVALVNDALRGE